MNNVGFFTFALVKSNIVMMLPALASNEPEPIRVPPSQLSSMNFVTDAWLIRVWSTKFERAYGEITMNGVRVPGPHRPLTGAPFTPGSCEPVPHLPAPLTWSALASKEGDVGVAYAWSYQPSESSSHATITAVLAQSGCCCRKLTTFVVNACSSSGSE